MKYLHQVQKLKKSKVQSFQSPKFQSSQSPKFQSSQCLFCFQMSMIHIEDVASIFVKSLEDKKFIKKIIELGGENITWRNIIKTISKAAGKNKFTVPAPVFAVQAVASLFERFSWFPVTKDQLTMLVQGNTCDSDRLFSENDGL